MDVAAVKDLCAGFPGASKKLFGAPSNVLVYYVGGKKFAYFKTSEPEQWRFSFRASADRFLELTGMPGLKPARYLGRFYWVTIVNVGSVPSSFLAELIASSYDAATIRPERGCRAGSARPRPSGSPKLMEKPLRD